MEFREKVIEALKCDKSISELFLKSLTAVSDKKFYPEALNLFINIDLTPEEARSAWKQIIAMKDGLFNSLKMNISLIVLYYFMEVRKTVLHPFVMEYIAYDNLRKNAIYDFLTGVFNRSFFHNILRIETERAQRYKSYLSLIMIDLDNFKEINDKKGHLAGDKTLCAFAEELKKGIRESDFLFRFGGDEFAVLLPQTDLNGSILLIERLAPGIKKRLKLTFSTGISSFKIDSFTEKEILEHADFALYDAKNSGKGQISTFLKDRRRYFRLPAAFEFLYLLPNETDYLFSEGRNISENGLLFMNEMPIAVETNMKFTFRIPHSDYMINGEGRVVRIEKLSEKVFEIGVDFTKVSKEDLEELAKYLSRYSLGPLK